MSEIVSVAEIHDALEKITAASRNQPGNQEEILKLLKQIPMLSKSILPIVYNSQPTSIPHTNVLKLFQYISKHLVNELKQLVQGTVTNIDRPKRTCICLENLTLLAGNDFAMEKFTEVVSHATSLLIQENLEFVEDPVDNLPRVAESLVSLIQNIKPFAIDMHKALFLCDVWNMTGVEQRNCISNVILEKLSTELLTVVDALKEFAMKTSSGKVQNFLQVDSNPLETCMSTANLLALGMVLNAFNDLERNLHGSIASKVLKLKNSSDKFKKSSLKHRLPDILRSSQEGSWMRSPTLFGEWDWQEILRDIAPAVSNSMIESFENFHTREMSSLKNSQCDEAYRVDIVSSLSSEWMPGENTPKKTICQFKEAVSLIKGTLPYGVIGSYYKPLSSLLSCYIDECSQSLKMMKTYLSMLLNDFPEKVTASDIFCSIAACEDVIITLQYCSANMNTDIRAPFQGICQSYCDMDMTFKGAVIQYLCSRIRLTILHDGESNHFSDPKEFADGERCSFAVENWRTFLGRMQKEMDSTLSNSSTKEIFSAIFLDSLNVLKMRYLRCEPSYNRTKQLSFDIPYIISTCEEYLFGDSLTSPNRSLFNDDDCDKISSICQLLHATMALLSVPLSVLRNCLSNRPDEENIQLSNSKSVVVRFLGSQIDNQDLLLHCMVALLSNDNSFLCFVQSGDFANELGAVNAQHFHHCIYQVLASSVSLWCDEFFNCALLSVNNDTDLLLQNCMINTSSYNYPWQSVFFDKLDAVLCKSLVAPVSFLAQPCWSQFMKNVILSFPPNIRTTVSDMASKDDDTESRLMVSVILILLSLKNALYVLPEWLTKFFMNLKSISEKQSENNITAIEVILNETRKVLNNPGIWEEHCHLDLTKDGVDAMHRASLVILRICSKDFQPNSVSEEVVVHFLNSLCKEANTCFRLLPETEFHYSDEELFQECKLELADMDSFNENGWNALKTVCMILKENADWLKSFWARARCHNSTIKSLRSLQTWDEKCLASLSRVNWKTIKIIVLHRWEARSGAALTDDQAEDLDMILRILETNDEA